MKVKFIFLLFVAMIVLSSCVPDPAARQTSQAVEIPQALKLILSALILAGVTLGLQVVFDSVGIDLRGVGNAVAVAVSAFVIAQVQGYIDVIPAEFDGIVLMVLNVAVVILGGLGTLQALFNSNRAAKVLS